MESNGLLRINLGSGLVNEPGYVNIDLHAECADLKHDLTTGIPYPDDSVDEIRAFHIIEHFTRREWEALRKEMFRVLKPGGRANIRCPDLLAVMHKFIANERNHRWDLWILNIYGGQEDYGGGQLHKNGFTLEKLKYDLYGEGFTIEDAAENVDAPDTPELRVIVEKKGGISQ